jgi:hypothetical protein
MQVHKAGYIDRAYRAEIHSDPTPSTTVGKLPPEGTQWDTWDGISTRFFQEGLGQIRVWDPVTERIPASCTQRVRSREDGIRSLGVSFKPLLGVFFKPLG